MCGRSHCDLRICLSPSPSSPSHTGEFRNALPRRILQNWQERPSRQRGKLAFKHYYIALKHWRRSADFLICRSASNIKTRPWELHRSRCAFRDAPFSTFRQSASALATFPRTPFLAGLLGPTPPPPCHLSTSWLPSICKLSTEGF